MDPLSEVLALLKPGSHMFRGIDGAGQWSISIPQVLGIKCYAVVTGECWLTVEKLPEPLLLKAGDCVLLPSGCASCLCSDKALKPAEVGDVMSTTVQGGVVKINGGGGCFGMGGFFAFRGGHADTLFGILPPLIHIRPDTDKETLRWCVERLMKELRDPQPGGALITEQLSHMLLVLALRAYMAEGPKAGVGWMFALADKQIGAVMTVIHADAGRRWTLPALADVAGMSRSTFALKFKERVGEPPLEYLTRWRMLVAGDRLTAGKESISSLSLAMGYNSESAFSAAFKRVMGHSPREHGRAVASTAAVFRSQEQSTRADPNQ